MNTETTYDGYPASGAVRDGDIRSGMLASVGRAIRRFQKRMLASHWERQTAYELSTLPNHLLRDIGMYPSNIREVARDLAQQRAEDWARRAGGSNGFGG